ncbi:MAG TPA: choice-of-anchor Q domain-containing protein, partial [Herpetosiphonaceae bacterium]|nr:choice-of-anchor Q domain-containing protein [Herpetosiphonaceae bacterium]
QAPDAAGTLRSGGHNLIGNTAGVQLISGDTAGNQLNVAALLEPLAANGGAAPTHAPLPNSPAIDAASPAAPGSGGGACAPADQRGIARPQDGDGKNGARCDIGAVEISPIMVDTAADDTAANANCTLREAIRAANLDQPVDGCAAGNGPDTISVPAGVYAFTQLGVGEDAAVTGDLDITEDLTITGALSATTIIDAALADRGLDIHGGRVVLENLTIRRGRINGSVGPISQFWGGAGILVRSAAPTSSLELRSSAVTDNRAQANDEWTRGGGIYSAAPLTVSGSLISNNAASEGGGVYSQGGLVFDRSVALQNQAKSGGGITSQGALSVTQSLISNNAFFQAGPFGYATGSGIHASGDSHISGSTVSLNKPGGGLWLTSRAAITNTLIFSNTSYAGGGIANFGRLSLVGSTVSHNVAEKDEDVIGGGGIRNNGEMIVATSVISANSAEQAGGLANYGRATINASTIANNVALGGTDETEQLFGHGGGVYSSGQITMTNVTVSGNSAQLSGGGLASAGSSGRMILNNSTVTNNLADRSEDELFTGGDGGGVYASKPISVTNTIIAGNATRTGQRPDGSGTLLSGGHNLIGNASGLTLTGDLTGNRLNVAALLGPLANNGGATPTHALLPNSPAIDAASPAAPGSGGGACAPADQRGVARPLDGDGKNGARCDIGAVEAPAVAPVLKRLYLPFITR